jgi:hypothetical protein
VQYSNDDPFGTHIKPDYWRHLKNAIPFFDIHFIYRQSNKSDFEQAGARVTHLLRSYYIPGEDYRVPLGKADQSYLSEVVFAGHYEADGRLELLAAIASAGYRLNLFGGGWGRTEKKLPQKSSLKPLFPVSPLTGEGYRKAISGAKIALCFLSKINNDTYTRRNFQIPAMQTFMLSEYSEDLASLFEEGTEAEYFRTREELLDKVTFYLVNDAARDKIAQRGHDKLLRSGHDVTSRMREFLVEVMKLKDGLRAK